VAPPAFLICGKIHPESSRSFDGFWRVVFGRAFVRHGTNRWFGYMEELK
jgi:hypothetical protein